MDEESIVKHIGEIGIISVSIGIFWGSIEIVRFFYNINQKYAIILALVLGGAFLLAISFIYLTLNEDIE